GVAHRRHATNEAAMQPSRGRRPPEPQQRRRSGPALAHVNAVTAIEGPPDHAEADPPHDDRRDRRDSECPEHVAHALSMLPLSRVDGSGGTFVPSGVQKCPRNGIEGGVGVDQTRMLTASTAWPLVSLSSTTRSRADSATSRALWRATSAAASTFGRAASATSA